MAEQQAGWYADPSGDASKLRYWDGTQWTDSYMEAAATQPVASAQTTQPYQAQQPYQQTQPYQPVQQQPQQYSQYPQQPRPAAYGQPKPSKGKVLGIIALVLGVIGIGLSWIPFINFISFVPILAGIVLSVIALIQARGGRGPKVFSVIALIVSTVALIVAIIMVFIVAMIATDVNDKYQSAVTTVEEEEKPFVTRAEEEEKNKSTTEEEPTQIEEEEEAEEADDVVYGRVGQECKTKWFNFTVNSMTTASTYDNTTSAEGSFSALDGNILVIANITITNTMNFAQPFGTFDWFIHDDTSGSYTWPRNPQSVKMIPEEFTLEAGETATYDVVIEISGTQKNVYLMYVEQDKNKQLFTAFKIPVY